MKNIIKAAIVLSTGLSAHTASAVYFNAKGHLSLRGASQTAPEFKSGTGTYQATERSFSLFGEARVNDKVSVFMDLRLVDILEGEDPLLGNSAATASGCEDGDESCTEAFSGDSDYAGMVLLAPKAHARIATEYCIIEAGRRGRDWGMGIFLDSGNDPFETSASVFDGVSCDVNIQKSQTLGFSLGFDKISEGSAFTIGDDIEQFFASVEYDDRDSSAAAFSKRIGLYVANISSGGGDEVGTVDYKMFDIFAAFYLGNITIESEALIRTGKSEEKNWSAFGASGTEKHSLDAISFAIRGDWEFSKSGTSLGVKPYLSGNASRHLMFAEYIRSPGDADGYYKGTDPDLGDIARDSAAEALPIHKNYIPTLILFNASRSGNMDIDGVYASDQIINANVFSLGYRFEGIDSGYFETKITTASMIESMPSDIESAFDAGSTPAGYYNLAGDYPVGYFGDSIGTELGLTYGFTIGANTTLEFAGAYAFAGDALQTTDESVKDSTALRSTLSVQF